MSNVWMADVWISLVVFLCLSGASVTAMYVWPILPARHRDDDTSAVVRLIANIPWRRCGPDRTAASAGGGSRRHRRRF
jgi:hypothetical protein